MRTLILNAASNLALPVSALVTSPLLARSLGPDGRGELAAVVAPMLFITAFLTLGIPEGVTYLIASRQWSLRRGVVTGAIAGTLAGGLAGTVLFLSAPILLVHSPEHIGLLRGLACLLPVTLAGLSVRAGLHGLGDFSTINAERWTSVLSRLALLLGASACGLLTVASAAWITNLTAVAAFGLLLLACRRRLGRGPSRRIRFAPLLRYGSRAWVGTLSVVIMLRADQVMMAPLVASAELGFYAVAVAIAEVPAAGFTALKDILFFRLSADGDGRTVATAARMSLLVALPLVLVGILLAPPAVRLVFGAEFAPAAQMAQIMLAATVPAGLANMMGAGLMGQGHPGRVSITQASAAIASLVLVVVLVPRWGGTGAALATLITYVLLWAAMVGMFVRASSLRVRDLVLPAPADLRELRSRLRLPTEVRTGSDSGSFGRRE